MDLVTGNLAIFCGNFAITDGGTGRKLGSLIADGTAGLEGVHPLEPIANSRAMNLSDRMIGVVKREMI